MESLNILFCLLGLPTYLHIDHGGSFMNKELKAFLLKLVGRKPNVGREII